MPPSDGLQQAEEAGRSSRSNSNAQRPPSPPTTMSSRKRLGMAALRFILLAGAGVIIGVFVQKHNANKGTLSATTTGTSAASTPITTTSVHEDTTIPSSNDTPASKDEIPAATTTTTTTNTNEGTFNAQLNPQQSSPQTLAAAAGKAAAGSMDLSKIKLKPPVVNKAPAENTCLAEDFDELKEAVEERTCQFITLTGDTYDVEAGEEIIVGRSVTISGNPQTMPVINGQEAARSFRVLAGAFLEIRYAQIVMSEGITRDPLPWEGATTEKVIEIRGGSVYFEPGALGRGVCERECVYMCVCVSV